MQRSKLVNFNTNIIQVITYILFISLSACNDSVDRLRGVGKLPTLNRVENPLVEPTYKPVTWPEEEVEQNRSPNSLWRPGARTFFRDQRARRVGDIVKITINIADKADFDNKTETKRGDSDNLNLVGMLGLENKIPSMLPGGKAKNTGNLSNLVNVTGANDHSGEGKIARKEIIQTQVAAIVTQILPNGNLVVRGKQEVRVNYELREVAVEGIARPEDISSDNSISSDQIAEARISYGGRGKVSDIQQPRWGTQVLDIISPF